MISIFRLDLHPSVFFTYFAFSVSCEQCILQWTYTAGNNWGMCDNGTGDLGCGPQVNIILARIFIKDVKWDKFIS